MSLATVGLFSFAGIALVALISLAFGRTLFRSALFLLSLCGFVATYLTSAREQIERPPLDKEAGLWRARFEASNKQYHEMHRAWLAAKPFQDSHESTTKALASQLPDAPSYLSHADKVELLGKRLTSTVEQANLQGARAKDLDAVLKKQATEIETLHGSIASESSLRALVASAHKRAMVRLYRGAVGSLANVQRRRLELRATDQAVSAAIQLGLKNSALAEQLRLGERRERSRILALVLRVARKHSAHGVGVPPALPSSSACDAAISDTPWISVTDVSRSSSKIIVAVQLAILDGGQRQTYRFPKSIRRAPPEPSLDEAIRSLGSMLEAMTKSSCTVEALAVRGAADDKPFTAPVPKADDHRYAEQYPIATVSGKPQSRLLLASDKRPTLGGGDLLNSDLPKVRASRLLGRVKEVLPTIDPKLLFVVDEKPASGSDLSPTIFIVLR